jgi:heptosyltransferase II
MSNADSRPILIIPYMWIGDFVRCHTVVRMLRARWPQRPVDVLTTSLCAPLVDYMPDVRRGIVWDLPRKQMAIGQHRALARRLRAESYGTALIMPRTWKSALAPALAGIPERIGFLGEGRIGLLTDIRWNERRLPRMVDRCASLAVPAGAALPPQWPRPQLVVPQAALSEWTRSRVHGSPRPAVALAPGAVSPSKRWSVESYAALAHKLTARQLDVWVVGGPGERPLAAQIARCGGPGVRDLTGADLRDAIMALAAARAAVSNDSGLLHVAAALGTPSIGIFGPTSPWHWAPLNPLAGTIETAAGVPCRPCHKPTCRLGHHRCMSEIDPQRVADATLQALM